MAEHLSNTPVIDHIVSPYPTGIEANPGPNGIDPSKPPTIVAAEAQYMGQLVTSACLNTLVNLELGEESYSEIEIEGLLEARAAEITEQRHITEARVIAGIATTSGDTSRRDAANTTMMSGIDPQYQDQFYHNQRQIEELESLGTSNLTRAMSNKLKSLKQEQRILKRRHSSSTSFKKARAFSQRRQDRSVRAGLKMLGKSEAQIADIIEDRGDHRGLRHGRESRETRNRSKAEDEQTRNVISRKGVVIALEDGRKHVVEDVVPTPAQGFKVLYTSSSGDPVFDEDPITNEPILHDLYLPELDKKGQPKIDPRTGKVIIKTALNPTSGLIEKVTVPRDDPHLRSGHDKTAGAVTAKGPFFYEDGSPVNSKSISADSFKPTDDRVILKPLLSGAEAVEVIVKGVNSGIDLRDKHITLGHVVRHVRANPHTIVSEPARKQLLQNSLVFRESYSYTSPSLRPQNDINHNTGHFERFDYVDPVTTRKLRIRQQAELYGVERIVTGRKKKRYKVRDERLSG